MQTVRRDIGSRDSMPRPDHPSPSMRKLRNEFALRSSKRTAVACLSISIVRKTSLFALLQIGSCYPYAGLRALRFRFGNRHGEEAAVVRVAGSFGRDKQPRGLKGFRVMYTGGGYLGLGTREEKTNERMDARRVCARILSTFFPCLSFFLAFHLPPSSAGGKYAENTPSESIYRIHTQLVFPGLGRPNQIL